MSRKIGNAQATMLVVNSILPTAIIVLPIIIGTYLEQDSPWAVVFSCGVGLLIAALIGTIVRNNHGAPFLEWVGKISSPIVATIVGLFLLQYYLDATASVLREFINFLKDNVLFETPVPVLVAVALLVVVYMAYRGIDVIAKVNSLIFFLYVIVVPFYMFGLKDYLDVHHLLPAFEHPFNLVVMSSLTPIGWLSEVSILLFLAPYLKNPEKARRIGSTGLILVSLLMLLNVVTTLMVFGPDYIEASSYPGFDAISVVHVGTFLENLDILFISYWILSVYLKLGIFLFGTFECFKQTFRVTEKGPYLIALMMVVCAECMHTWRDPTKLNMFNAEGRFPVFMLLNVFVPLSLYWYSLINKPKSKRKESPS
ncbi:GerAB/ArcD/ProY family transporter [Paenibacillus macerans]|uniref:GerAB/ArcD/ProY family transporter n=1 Tax=Paenibacillus macerans TaxID=44252 RepID=UPI003D3208A9